MIIVLLSTAMMFAMLVATGIALHEEAQKRRADIRVRTSRIFGPLR